MSEIPATASVEEPKMNGVGTLPLNPTEPLVSKRQRRPSVRLGDIGGDTTYDSHRRQSTKPWKFVFEHHRRDSNNVSGKPSKTRPLTNLSSAEFGGDTLDGGHDDRDATANADGVVIGNWKVKDSKKRGSSGAPTKRARSNWVSRIEDGGSGVGDGEDRFFSGGGGDGEDRFFSGGDVDVDDGYSESLKEPSPVNSLENLGVDRNDRELNFQGNSRSVRVRVSEGRENRDGIELSGPSDNDIRDRNRNNGDGGSRGMYGDDGVKIWLNGLGLSRYAPVFEIHEVDDEVLPLLTLEDLKDMGINAVGSRRKMYCAIQKLGKGFS
ncbi:PREDICTED: uncharacterized protein LOC109337025 isoform X2 [Lupinus angustifolius]|uniref:uncharacterized protein LOC109337025 isoform X2 n=1 Tax=Lupinus angustifolius TaxID=3871 RepID=UPI00092F4DB7|nr:PREDICTED: uncharacterized protein LOC109337025 isoform X2 [Lupinus angustifolius]